jgi:integrase
MKAKRGINRRHRAGCAARQNPDRRCDCPYEAGVYDPSSGKYMRRILPTLAEARAWRSDAEHGIRRGTLRAAGPVTVNDAADELLAGMRSGSIRNRSGDPFKPSTTRSYETSLELYVRPHLGAMRLAEVKRRHVQNLADLLVAEDAAPSTVRNALMPLRVIFRRALRDDEVSVNPCDGLELPANRRRRERVASREDVGALVAALPEPFDRALWATALYAGLRRGELLALRWSDLDTTEGVIRVERAYDPKACEYVKPKSRAGVRRVPMPSALRHALLEHRLAFGTFDPEALVFGVKGRPFDDEVVRDRAAEVWTEAKLEPIGLHEARHTAASVMIAAGVNVKALSEFLGHSSITTTLDLYGHLLPGSLAEAAGLVDAYLDRTDGRTYAATTKSLQTGDSGRS